MYYQEKKTIVSIVSGVLILVLYSLYGISKYREVGMALLDDLKFWSTAMLFAIGGGVLIFILIQIIFHIALAVANEVRKEVSKKARENGVDMPYEEMEIEEIEDERDRLFALKAMRNSYVVVGLGFALGLISILMEMPPGIMLNIFFGAFSIGSIFEGCTQLYFYRRGV